MNKIIDKYKAIGEETRLRILCLLVKSDIELCSCELIDILEKPQYNISKSLGKLKRANLIKERRDGRMMVYWLNKDTALNKELFNSILTIEYTSNEILKKDLAKLDLLVSQPDRDIVRKKLCCSLCS